MSADRSFVPGLPDVFFLKTRNEQSGLFKASPVLKFLVWFWSFCFYLVFLPTVSHSECNLHADVQIISFFSMKIKLKLK
jgi:hypothetical protein